ncbi:MAG TPA: hypothetical protein GX513_02540 [Firmicutes bacterium]|nr:hypothetical protein [Bacillota bacterium]
MKNVVIDLRSDTVTKPTQEMLQAMLRAELGDDCLGDPSAVTQLEVRAARLLGKEAALFVPTGMMGNGLALRLFVRPGDFIVCAEHAHLYSTGLAGFVGATPLLVPAPAGHLEIDTVARFLDGHDAPARLLCLENTYNAGGGEPWTVQETRELCSLAEEKGIPVHLDGARLFDAAVALGEEADRLASPATTVMCCLSKGLSAPVGSILAGPQGLISQARELRHLAGGSMRQSGLLAAAGMVALESMVSRLAEDHRHARRLAHGLEEIPFVRLTKPADGFKTNMVFFEVASPWTPESFVSRLAERGILCLALGARVRMVTHRHVTDEDVERVIQTVHGLA